MNSRDPACLSVDLGTREPLSAPYRRANGSTEAYLGRIWDYHDRITDEEVFAAALRLGQKERSDLADRLLDSLDTNAEHVLTDEWERAWGEEAARRLEKLREGQGQEIPGEQVLKELRDLLA